MSLRERVFFLSQFFENFHHTGSLTPSSRFLARAITRPLVERDGPARILGVGPGTGAFTREIARAARPGDVVDLYEINPRFVAYLRARFASEEPFRSSAVPFNLVEAPVETAAGGEPYDFIVTGLPFNNFPEPLVERLFGILAGLLKPGGTFSYFEYLFFRRLKQAVSIGGGRRRLREIGRITAEYRARHPGTSRTVVRNVMPAVVYHLRKAGIPETRNGAAGVENG